MDVEKKKIVPKMTNGSHKIKLKMREQAQIVLDQYIPNEFRKPLLRF